MIMSTSLDFTRSDSGVCKLGQENLFARKTSVYCCGCKATKREVSCSHPGMQSDGDDADGELCTPDNHDYASSAFLVGSHGALETYKNDDDPDDANHPLTDSHHYASAASPAVTLHVKSGYDDDDDDLMITINMHEQQLAKKSGLAARLRSI